MKAIIFMTNVVAICCTFCSCHNDDYIGTTQKKWIAPGELVVTNNKAGELDITIGILSRDSIQKLTVSGALDGTDIAYIRDMINKGILQDVDIQKTSIVTGGLSSCHTSNDTIGEFLFYDCEKLESIKLPSTVKSIEDGAFENCLSLKEIELPRNCKTLNLGAFYNCDNLDSIILQDSLCKVVVSDGYRSYGETPRKILVSQRNPYFKSINGTLFSISGKTLVICPHGIRGDYSIPEGTDTIAPKAFYYNRGITNATFPDGLTFIGDNAFAGTNLQSIELPNSVTEIGNGAFENTDLREASLPEKLTVIRDYAFANIFSLRSINIPNSVTEIGNHAFYHTHLEEVHLPDKLTSIGDYAFADYWLRSINIPNSVTEIGKGAFYDTDLEEVNLPDGIKELKDETFASTELTEVAIGPILTKISRSAFMDCHKMRLFSVDKKNESYCSIGGVLYSKDRKALISYPCGRTDKNVYIADGVTEICDYAFRGNDFLESVHIPSSTKLIGEEVFAYSTLKNIYWSNEIDSIGKGTFCYCNQLDSIVLPNQLKTISEGLFNGCTNLKHIIIPAQVGTIGLYVFGGCENLFTIHCKVKDIENLHTGKYSSIWAPEGCTWIVPAGSKDKYKAQSWWRSTWNIKEDE